MTEAFNVVGKILDVKPRTVKNLRDEFDPIHPNPRKGWYQREFRPSRLEVIEKYGNLGEDALTEVIKDILAQEDSNIIKENVNLYEEIINSEDNEPGSRSVTYTTRGITGKRAEELFKDYFENGLIMGLYGELIDKREGGWLRF